MIAAKQKSKAKKLHILIKKILEKKCLHLASVSLECCLNIITHYDRDVIRLANAQESKKLHPSKPIGYLAFWIRKLKPISNAYPLNLLSKSPTGELSEECLDINEMVAIYIMGYLLEKYAEKGVLIPNQSKEKTLATTIRVTETFHDLLNSRLFLGSEAGNVFSSLKHDMRYRTFGPHHMVHIVNSIIWRLQKR